MTDTLVQVRLLCRHMRDTVTSIVFVTTVALCLLFIGCSPSAPPVAPLTETETDRAIATAPPEITYRDEVKRQDRKGYEATKWIATTGNHAPFASIILCPGRTLWHLCETSTDWALRRFMPCISWTSPIASRTKAALIQIRFLSTCRLTVHVGRLCFKSRREKRSRKALLRLKIKVKRGFFYGGIETHDPAAKITATNATNEPS